jgi:ribonuclease R
MEAERRAFERFVATFMASQVGASFRGRVAGITGFGLFVSLTDSGAEGLVPTSSLGDEFFALDERHHALVGQRTGETFGLGDAVRVELLDADPVQGTLRFRLLEHEQGHGARLARADWRKSGGRTPRSGGRPPPRGRRPRR